MLLQHELMCGWNGDPEHVIDAKPYFTRLDIENQGNQARKLENAMVA